MSIAFITEPIHVDLFFVFRRFLVLFVSIYTALHLIRTLWRWFKFLTFPSRSRKLMRHYLIVQLLRTRLRRFAGDGLQIAALLAIMVGIVYLHGLIEVPSS